jgi:predicted 3-demethylubiquinone-9 3-methyltransferase (glyoxalase superfamily)
MQKITPFLWFDNQAEEAAEYYVSIFPNSRITEVSRYSEAGPGPVGSAMVVAFELDGSPFLALNGGPDHFGFDESISLSIDCKDQEEVDYYWNALSAGGAEIACGWLHDKYSLRWQVVPSELPVLLADPDRARAKRTAEAMFTMKKLDIAGLRAAADNAAS